MLYALVPCKRLVVNPGNALRTAVYMESQVLRLGALTAEMLSYHRSDFS